MNKSRESAISFAKGNGWNVPNNVKFLCDGCSNNGECKHAYDPLNMILVEPKEGCFSEVMGTKWKRESVKNGTVYRLLTTGEEIKVYDEFLRRNGTWTALTRDDLSKWYSAVGSPLTMSIDAAPVRRRTLEKKP